MGIYFEYSDNIRLTQHSSTAQHRAGRASYYAVEAENNDSQ